MYKDISIDFLKHVEHYKPQVWKEIQKYLSLDSKNPYDQMINEYPARQGKYFRPTLLIMSARLHGAPVERCLLSAAALQVSEDWLLIHDDVEDHSTERRHKPSLNKMFGEELAINAGDALHIIMWKILRDNIKFLGNNIGFKVFDKMQQTLLTTTEGQYLELSWIKNNIIEIKEYQYFEMAIKKTAGYTTVAPAQIGAIIAEKGSKQNLDKINEWALPFGLAFQIYDDVMNLIESSKSQGKESAGDILEGKRTIILCHLLSKCSSEEKQMVNTIYSKSREQKTESEKKFILDLMNKYESIEYAADIAKKYSGQALDLFNKYSKDFPNSESKQAIEQAIQFVVNRKK